MARIFLLKGDIANPGYVDIPDEATTIREVIYGIGGGIPNGKKFKAAQTGGPSGGCIPTEHLDTPIDYENLVLSLRPGMEKDRDDIIRKLVDIDFESKDEMLYMEMSFKILDIV